MDTQRENTIIASINKHFGFLLDAGYRLGIIRQTGKMGCWDVNLESEELVFRLISDRGEVFLTLSPFGKECWIGLDIAIFFVTDEKELIPAFEGDLFHDEDKQFARLAQPLRKYFNNIKSVFGQDFDMHKDELLMLRKKMNKLPIKRFMDER